MINQKKLATALLALNKEALIIYILYLRSKILIYQASKAQMTSLSAKKVSIPEKHTDFLDIFSKKSTAVLFNNLDINKECTIDLNSGKQLLYRPIYNLGPVELETFKIYIKANLANRFIQHSKFPTRIAILFV